MTLVAAIARLEQLVDDDEVFTLRRVARGNWEAWSYVGDVGRGTTAAAAATELAGKLR